MISTSGIVTSHLLFPLFSVLFFQINNDFGGQVLIEGGFCSFPLSKEFTTKLFTFLVSDNKFFQNTVLEGIAKKNKCGHLQNMSHELIS